MEGLAVGDERKGEEITIEVIPAPNPRHQAEVVVKDARGKTLTTYRAQLADDKGRRDLARKITAKFGGDPDKLEELIEAKWAAALDQAREQAAEEAGQGPAPQYHDSDGYLVLERATQAGTVTLPLANWTARIVAQTTVDDGAERHTILTIQGQLDGAPLPRVDVPAGEFGSMRWVIGAWGTRAVVYAGPGVADHLRVAVQVLSGDPPTRTVFAHTGWREVGSSWVYLHAGGAVGTVGTVAGVEVSLPDALGHYLLPDPPGGDELVQAVRSSLAILDLAPDRITAPLLGAAYRAVLGPADFALHLCGPTSAGKTELAALAQQHWGAGMDSRHLPGSWASTGNSLEALAFACKDAALVVDDFAPGGGVHDVARMHREADRLLRAQGNRSGRMRLGPDAKLRPVRFPRGTILSTGEDVMRGQSLRARLLVLELAPGDLVWAELTARQAEAAAGRYAQALAGYVRWLAANYQEVRDGLRAQAAAVRGRLKFPGAHGRVPGLVADLLVGWKHWLDFALAAGAITEEDRKALKKRVWKALSEAAREQAAHGQDAEPCLRFLRLLAGLLASGGCHCTTTLGCAPGDPEVWGWRGSQTVTRDGSTTRWDPQGPCVGWLEGSDLFLEPEASYAAVQKLARDQGDSLGVSARTLWRRMGEGKHLASRDETRQRMTVRKMIGSQRREVIHIAQKALCACLGPSQPSQPSHSTSSAGPKSDDSAAETASEGVSERDPGPKWDGWDGWDGRGDTHTPAEGGIQPPADPDGDDHGDSWEDPRDRSDSSPTVPPKDLFGDTGSGSGVYGSGL
jgi:hypothetical protein